MESGTAKRIQAMHGKKIAKKWVQYRKDLDKKIYYEVLEVEFCKEVSDSVGSECELASANSEP